MLIKKIRRFFLLIGFVTSFGCLSCTSLVGELAVSSKLTPVFPSGCKNPVISSPFNSWTRADGSRRNYSHGNGAHKGIDLTLPEGTPLRAIADGRVIAVGTGAQAEGNFIWTLYPPITTGLPYFLFSKYQHIKSAEVKVGTFVKSGEIIALSGRTGTEGEGFGPFGYAHLHWTIMKSPRNQYDFDGKALSIDKSRIIDPMLIYKPIEGDQMSVGNSPTDGLLWPVPCEKAN